MTDRHAFFALVAILLAICYLGTIAGFLAFSGKYTEAVGFGGLTTGLVGVLGTFRPRSSNPETPQSVTVTNDAADPVPTVQTP